MKRKFLSVFALLFFTASVVAQENTAIEISGRVTDQEKQEPIADVSVQIKGTVAGAITNKSGRFVLRTKARLPFTIVFTSVGFRPHELEVKSPGSELQIALVTQTVLGNEVVVTASRVAESILNRRWRSRNWTYAPSANQQRPAFMTPWKM